jgi:hypothetical protein
MIGSRTIQNTPNVVHHSGNQPVLPVLFGGPIFLLVLCQPQHFRQLNH